MILRISTLSQFGWIFMFVQRYNPDHIVMIIIADSIFRFVHAKSFWNFHDSFWNHTNERTLHIWLLIIFLHWSRRGFIYMYNTIFWTDRSGWHASELEEGAKTKEKLFYIHIIGFLVLTHYHSSYWLHSQFTSSILWFLLNRITGSSLVCT